MKKLMCALIALLFIGSACFAQQQKSNSVRTGKHKTINLGTPVRTNVAQNLNTRAVIWSDNFSTPANWTLTNEAGNTDNWVIGTAGPAGSYPIDAIASTSGGNFALFDSDALCSHDQVANITTTNNIDLTGHPAVVLKFEQYYRRYADSTFVFVSTNGTTWTKFVVNADVASNPSYTEAFTSQANEGD